jgi:hypothetical protein
MLRRLTTRPRRVAAWSVLSLAVLAAIVMLPWDVEVSVVTVDTRSPTPAPTPRGTARERFLGVDLPLTLPKNFTDFLDALQFPEATCRYGMPVGTWYDFPLQRFGIGAYTQHYTWFMSLLAAERRMFVMLTEPSKKQQFQYGHSQGCRQGFFCGFHPISKCADVEVWSGSEMLPEAERTGRFLGHYGKAKRFNKTLVKARRDDRVDIGGRWYSDLPERGRCRWGHWVPPQFRTVGTADMWDNLMDKCKFDAFDSLPDGRVRASKDVLRWRSWLAGYLFQPLPAVMKSIAAKQKRTRLDDGDRCVSLHVRRGDKLKGAHIEGKFHALDDYLALAQQLIERHNGSGTVVLHSDDFVGLLAEWKTSRFRGKVRLLHDPSEEQLSGWNVNLLYSLEDFYNVIGSVWLFSQCPLTVGSLESVYYKLGMQIGMARGIFEADNNIYGARFVIGALGNPLRGWFNFLA